MHPNKEMTSDKKIITESAPPPLPRFINKLPNSLDNRTADTLLFFKRSACFGFCPVYDYTLFTDGLVYYNGIMHNEPLGEHYALMSEGDWDKIKLQANQINFFHLEDRYPIQKENYIPDLPSSYLMIKDGGLRKMICDNHSPPKELKQLELTIETILSTLTLQKAPSKN